MYGQFDHMTNVKAAFFHTKSYIIERRTPKYSSTATDTQNSDFLIKQIRERLVYLPPIAL